MSAKISYVLREDRFPSQTGFTSSPLLSTHVTFSFSTSLRVSHRKGKFWSPHSWTVQFPSDSPRAVHTCHSLSDFHQDQNFEMIVLCHLTTVCFPKCFYSGRSRYSDAQIDNRIYYSWGRTRLWTRCSPDGLGSTDTLLPLPATWLPGGKTGNTCHW